MSKSIYIYIELHARIESTQVLKKKNEAFRGFQHQDAHEFMNYFLNQIGEELQGEVFFWEGFCGGGDTFNWQ